MRAHRLAVALGLLLMFSALGVPRGAAEDHGGSSSASGSFVLGPNGSANDTVDVFLDAAGLALSAGDTVRFSWSANNGSGPAVNFSFYSHGASHTVLFSFTGVQDSGSWKAASAGPYGAQWANPSDAPVEVRYSFEVVRAPADLLVLSIICVVALLGAAAAWSFYRALRAEDKKGPGSGDSDASRGAGGGPPAG